MRSGLPELGVGIIFAPGLETVIEAGRRLLDVIEVEPEMLWLRSDDPARRYRLDARALDRLRQVPCARLVHGVGFPVGGSAGPDPEHMQPFLESIELLGPAWVSEHLGINRIRRGPADEPAGFLLPPLQTPAGARAAAQHILALRSRLPVPFAFETGANYLRPRPHEMSDGSFFRAVAEAADCGILLDLHNLWANERNGRQSLVDVLNELPLDRVWEVHLAGGQAFEGYWLDAHSGLISDELRQLALHVIPRLPNLKAIIFEIIPDYLPVRKIGTRELLEQMAWMRNLWGLRPRLPSRPPASPSRPLELPPADHAATEVAAWERELGAALGGDGNARAPAPLGADPGIAVYRALIRTVRAGTIVSTLTLATRMLRLAVGEQRFDEVLAAYFSSSPAHPFGSDEAAAFGAHLKSLGLAIPHLAEVLDFELAQQAALIDGASRTVRFTCDPMPLLEALGAGRMPHTLVPQRTEVVVGGSAASASGGHDA